MAPFGLNPSDLTLPSMKQIHGLKSTVSDAAAAAAAIACEIAPPETLLELYITITNGSVNFYSMNNNGFIMFAVIFHLQLYFQFYSYKWCYYSILFSITAIPVSIPVLWFGHVLV